MVNQGIMDINLESCVFYKSWYESAQILPEDIRLKFYEAVFDYALNSEAEELAIYHPVADALLIMIKPQIDSNKKKRKDGKKGGRPPKENNIKKTSGLNTKKPVVNHQKKPVDKKK